ncbi:undecaprenyl-diphosphate phosphatase (plasmid) [Bradyrhizobium guangxiense]|uniref:undecaprenyl-diphosphate phosphatase n=1 Tax=Bradyrhizobium guangxiense TaxID=1325115 RepID=UPI0037039728
MSTFQAYVIAILQGASELFPVSSLGHAVIVPTLLGWKIDQSAPSFLPFLVVLHVGTASALLIYFWRDWLKLLLALVGLGPRQERPAHLRVIGLIAVATIPAVIAGFALEKALRHLFGTPVVAALFLVVNGMILFGGERLRRTTAARGAGVGLERMSWRDALLIGLWQCLALIPGISRSGATMVGGLLRGLHHEAAAHFSFLIATPIIFGAAVLEVPKMLHQDASGITELAIASGALAGAIAFLSVWVLMRYFKSHDFQALNPFAYYCWTFGLTALALLVFAA